MGKTAARTCLQTAKCLHSSLDYVRPNEFEAKALNCDCMDEMDIWGHSKPFDVTFAVMTAFCPACSKTRPLEKLFLKRF